MKLTALALLLDALACYRLTRLVVDDTFPPIQAMRDRIVDRHTTELTQPNGIVVTRPGPLAELVQCPWCASVWLGALVVALRWNLPEWWTPVALVLALSAVAGIVSLLVDSEG